MILKYLRFANKNLNNMSYCKNYKEAEQRMHTSEVVSRKHNTWL